MAAPPDPTALAVAAADATGEVVWVIDADLGLVADSPSWRAFTGQSADEAAGRGWLHAFGPSDRAAVERALRESAREQLPGEVEHHVRRPTDRRTRARSRFVPVAGGGWVASIVEVWADESVRHSEERLRLATRAARVAVWEYDFVAGQMTRTDNHDLMYGLPEPAPVWTYDLFIGATHPDDVALSDRAVQEACAPGGPDRYAFDFRVIWPDRSLHWLAVSGEVVARDADGRATLVRGALIDVTRLKNAEEELRGAIRLRDEFLQIASHELRTPLTPLALKLESMERMLVAGRMDAEAIGRNILVARRQVRRLDALVDALLDVTRLARGRPRLDPSEVSLAEIARAVIEEIAPEAQRQGCEITLVVRGDAVGRWDRARIAQVIENLLANATKYGKGGPVVVTVSAAGRERASLSVRDHGMGIDPGSDAHIFERFGRAANAQAIGGLGLGLYIVRELVEAHGGTVQVESQPGQGATFTVELPMAVQDS